MATISRNARLTLAALGLVTMTAAGCGRSGEPESGVSSSQATDGALDLRVGRLTDAKGTVRGPAQDEAPKDWQSKDPDADRLAGTRADRAYAELGLGKGSTVVVAVIDSGVDIKHEDLQGHLWVNEKEANGQPGVDDDGDGYVDDVNGWNFIGGKDGRHVESDTLETTREYARLRKLKATLQGRGQRLSPADAALLAKVEKITNEGLSSAKQGLANWTANEQRLSAALKSVSAAMGVQNPTLDQIKAFRTQSSAVERDRQLVIKFYQAGFDLAKIADVKKHFSDQVNYHYNVDFDPRRDIVGDDPNNLNERFYGNGDVTGPDASHGTHCSGIIAALRENGLGMNGIADNVKIMPIRAIPNGDERDKDVANAVRFAVDHGAKIISMSFGKALSPNKDLVDAAFKYAASKGVLLVHAAGNDSKNNDVEPSFPNRTVRSSQQRQQEIPNWIEVGASTRFLDEKLPADFSNYGKTSVDLFAPGHEIWSTVPGSKYAAFSGTSMATPVVAGVAALVWAQYPKLTATQVKTVILNSVTPYRDDMVRIPQDDPQGQARQVRFDTLSRTGGVVDALGALKAAAAL